MEIFADTRSNSKMATDTLFLFVFMTVYKVAHVAEINVSIKLNLY